jgi:hypothetical protein
MIFNFTNSGGKLLIENMIDKKTILTSEIGYISTIFL